MIENISKAEIRDFCKSNSICARVTDIKFNPILIKNQIDNIIDNYPPTSKDKQSKYKALGLQYADEPDNLYESVESTRYFDANNKKAVIESRSFSDYSHWNFLGEDLKHLYKPIHDLGLKLYRTRILLAGGDYQSVNHIDYDWRYHIPIQTNKDCYLEYTDSGKNVHMPADGHAYILNAGFPHRFYNSGLTERYHYCGILSLPCKGDGEFDLYLKNGNKKALDYVYTL